MDAEDNKNEAFYKIAFILMCSLPAFILLCLSPALIWGHRWIINLYSALVKLNVGVGFQVTMLYLEIAMLTNDLLSLKKDRSFLGRKLKFTRLNMRYGDASMGLDSDQEIPLKNRLRITYPLFIIVIFSALILTIIKSN